MNQKSSSLQFLAQTIAIHHLISLLFYQVALRSVRKDLLSKRGHLVSLVVHPRLRAKKDIYVIGGSKRELVSAWTRSSECTFSSVEKFNTFTQ